MNRFYFALITTAAVLALAAGAALGLGSAGNGRLAFVADAAGTPQVFTIQPDGDGPEAGDEATERRRRARTFLVGRRIQSDLRRQHEPRPHVHVRGRRPRCAETQPALQRAVPGRRQSSGDAFWNEDRLRARLGPVVDDSAAIVGIFTTNADGSRLTS